MANEKTNLLVTLADSNYINQAKQLFSSVYWNAGWKGEYMLLAYDIPENELDWFRNKGILIRRCDPLYTGKNLGKWPIVVLSKCYLFSAEFKKWNNVVFLDADIIVRASLDDLSEVTGFSAVENSTLAKLFLTPWHLKLEDISDSNLREIEKSFSLSAPTFNTGVMAFNTAVIEDDTFKKSRECIDKYFLISASGEEAIINLIFYKNYQPLPSVYNVYPDYLISEIKIKSPDLKGIVLHFVLNKPWHKKSPFYKEWEFNFDRADLIGLKDVQRKVKSWSQKEIEDYQSSLDLRMKKYFYRREFFKIYRQTDRWIGLFGLFLKKHFPRIYSACKFL